MYRWPTWSPPSPAFPRRAPTRPDPDQPATVSGYSREEMHEIRTPKKMALVGLKICALALFLLLGAAAEDERKPNIVFMLMDDVS